MNRRKLALVIVAVSLASVAVAYAASTPLTSAKVTRQTASTTIPPQSVTTTVTLTDGNTGNQDSWVSENNEGGLTTNHGTESILRVKSGNGNRNARTFLQFNLADFNIPGTATITGGVLTLRTVACAVTPPRTYNLDRAVASWTETGVGGITFSNQPGVTGATVQATLTSCTPGTTSVSWNIPAADLQAWMSAPASNSGWRVRDLSEGENPNQSVDFGSSENITPANRPTLSITYTI